MYEFYLDDKTAQMPDKTEGSKSNTLHSKHTLNGIKFNNIMEESLNAIHERRESSWNGITRFILNWELFFIESFIIFRL